MGNINSIHPVKEEDIAVRNRQRSKSKSIDAINDPNRIIKTNSISDIENSDVNHTTIASNGQDLSQVPTQVTDSTFEEFNIKKLKEDMAAKLGNLNLEGFVENDVFPSVIPTTVTESSDKGSSVSFKLPSKNPSRSESFRRSESYQKTSSFRGEVFRSPTLMRTGSLNAKVLTVMNIGIEAISSGDLADSVELDPVVKPAVFGYGNAGVLPYPTEAYTSESISGESINVATSMSSGSLLTSDGSLSEMKT
jgi:hypothetical protein